MSSRILVPFVLFGITVGGGTGLGQNVIGPVVQIEGHAVVQPRPSLLRLTLQLQQTGTSAKEGLANLAQQRDSVIETLKQTQPTKSVSVRHNGPQIKTMANGPVLPTQPPTLGVRTYPIPPPSATTHPPLTPVGPALPPSTTVPSNAAPRAAYYPPADDTATTPTTPPRPYATYPPPTTPPVLYPSATPPTGAAWAPPTATPPHPQHMYLCETTITADWKLEGETIEQLLIAAKQLEQQIGKAMKELPATANITPVPNYSPRLSPVDPYSTTIVTPASMRNVSSTSGYLFVARISPEDRRAAWKRAYAQAERNAAELAAAAGRQLGEVVSLRRWESQGSPRYLGNLPPMSYDDTVGTSQDPRAEEFEVAALNAARLEYKCSVYAAFRLN